MKIYSDDAKVHYSHTEVHILRTRAEIDSLFAIYEIYETAWHWKPDQNDIWVMFNITETINEVPVKVAAKVVCNIIWDKANRLAKTSERRLERPNLPMSMRAMYYYIKSHLESSYAMQSSRTSAFLPNIINNEGKTVEQLIIPRIIADQQYMLADESKQDEWAHPNVRVLPQKNSRDE